MVLRNILKHKKHTLETEQMSIVRKNDIPGCVFPKENTESSQEKLLKITFRIYIVCGSCGESSLRYQAEIKLESRIED